MWFIWRLFNTWGLIKLMNDVTVNSRAFLPSTSCHRDVDAHQSEIHSTWGNTLMLWFRHTQLVKDEQLNLKLCLSVSVVAVLTFVLAQMLFLKRVCFIDFLLWVKDSPQKQTHGAESTLSAGSSGTTWQKRVKWVTLLFFLLIIKCQKTLWSLS